MGTGGREHDSGAGRRSDSCCGGQALRRLLAFLFVASAAIVAHGQTLTIAPQQVYVFECQETFVTVTGTNLTGTASTLVDFSGNSQLFELEPNTATSTQLEVW